jgi:hypothetical protein
MIIGGGIGGLCLAQGLRNAGIDVTVYERSLTRTDWLQGYRIHINPYGSRALHDCLEPANWQAFLDTVSRSGGGFGFTTEQLQDLLRFRADEVAPASKDPADRHYGVSRISLRQVLLSGMDDVVRLGKTFESYEVLPDGRVTTYFADGTSDTADLLIGADGANSRVRRQLLPYAERKDTGIVAVAGKHRLAEDSLARLPAVLTTDANMIIPARRGFLFTAVWQHDRRTISAGSDLPSGFLLDDTADYTPSGPTPTRPGSCRRPERAARRSARGPDLGQDPGLGAGAAEPDQRLGSDHPQCRPGPKRITGRSLGDGPRDAARRCHPQHDTYGRHRCQHCAARRRPAAPPVDHCEPQRAAAHPGHSRVRGTDAGLWLRGREKLVA